MKSHAKKFILYLFYVSFAMVLTTTYVFAVLGRCQVKEAGGFRYVGTVEGEEPCICPCEQKDRDSTGLYCHRCGHFMHPVGFWVVPKGKGPEPAGKVPADEQPQEEAPKVPADRHPFSAAAVAAAAEKAKASQ